MARAAKRIGSSSPARSDPGGHRAGDARGATAARRAACGDDAEAFFLSRNGTRLHYQCVRLVFMRLVAAAALEHRSPRSRPRPHSLRHSFAVNTLRDWYANDLDVQARLPLLTTHLGHVTPASTYYYLTATPDLLALAARRLEHTPERTPDGEPGTDA